MKAIKAEGISKRYKLGTTGTGSLKDDVWGLFKNKNLKDYIQKNEYWALNDVSFEVEQGDILGIIGRNGAGKSTLLKILSRITTPTKGNFKIKGRMSSLLEVGTGFHPELTGRENIFLNGSILGMKKPEIKSKLDEIINFSEIEKFIDTPVKRYSSGMYVRLAFGVAAHLEPDILIVDEVLAVGDAAFQKKCLGKMQDVNKKDGRTVLFVSHNMGVISTICTNTIWLEKGEIKMEGPTEKIISKYLNPDDSQVINIIKDEYRVRGNKLAKLIDCTILNNKDHKKNAFVIGEEIKFEFLVESKIEGDVGFWITVRDKEGNAIFCSHQKDQMKESISEGMYKMTYLTQGISLLPGNYTVAAGILNYPYTVFYEWVENCQSFEVLPAFLNGNKYDGRLGYFTQPSKWHLTKI